MTPEQQKAEQVLNTFDGYGLNDSDWYQLRDLIAKALEDAVEEAKSTGIQREIPERQ